MKDIVKSYRLGDIDLVIADRGRGVFLDVGSQALAQVIDIGRAGLEHLGRGWVVQQREQQMLDRDELVALLPRHDERHLQAGFEF